MSPRVSKKDALLAAALGLVAEHGYSVLTLDAVGKAAGVSKGGVLYHFPTKDALVVALIERLASGLAADQATGQGEDASAPGAATRGYLDAVTRQAQGVEHAASVAMLAAVAHDPRLLAPLQEQYRAWMARLDADGLPEVDAHIVRLAADGLWAAELFDLAPPDPVLRNAILARLQRLTRPTPARPR